MVTKEVSKMLTNNQRLNRVILLTQIANNQPYTHAGYTAANNTVRSWPDNSIK